MRHLRSVIIVALVACALLGLEDSGVFASSASNDGAKKEACDRASEEFEDLLTAKDSLGNPGDLLLGLEYNAEESYEYDRITRQMRFCKDRSDNYVNSIKESAILERRFPIYALATDFLMLPSTVSRLIHGPVDNDGIWEILALAIDEIDKRAVEFGDVEAAYFLARALDRETYRFGTHFGLGNSRVRQMQIEPLEFLDFVKGHTEFNSSAEYWRISGRDTHFVPDMPTAKQQ